MRHEFDEIARIVKDLQMRRGPTIRLMKDVLDRYEGDYVIPFPSMSNEPNLPPLTPMLVTQAVDTTARAAAGVMPRIICPAIDGMKDTGIRSREWGGIRERAIASVYQRSKWQLGVRKFYRHIAAYHTGAIIVVPDFETSMPRIEVRDPLGTFAEPQANEQLRSPAYVAFVTRLSNSRLRNQFPESRKEVGGVVPAVTREELWDIVEWWDDTDLVYGVVGPVQDNTYSTQIQNLSAPWMELRRYPNRTGMVPAIAPDNISLGKVASTIGAMVGSIDLQAKLQGLDIIAQEKAIFPDMFAIGRANGRPTIISNGGVWKDGREGEINLLTDIESVNTLRTTPDQRTSQTIDRLERNFRISNGLLPQAGGETYGALRTGRGIDALTGIAIDPRVQELHTLYEAWVPDMNRAILKTYKGYFGAKQYSMYSAWPGDRGLVEFTPNVHMETCENAVVYAIPGADVVQQTQILGSLFGAGAISRETFRSMHPYIDDADAERIIADEEQFESAFRDSVMAQIQQGTLPLASAIIMRDAMRKGDDIFQAVKAAEDAAKRAQATAAPPPPEGMQSSPEAMPGLAAGPGAMMQPPAEAAPQVEVPGDAARMKQLMQTMGA